MKLNFICTISPVVSSPHPSHSYTPAHISPCFICMFIIPPSLTHIPVITHTHHSDSLPLSPTASCVSVNGIIPTLHKQKNYSKQKIRGRCCLCNQRTFLSISFQLPSLPELCAAHSPSALQLLLPPLSSAAPPSSSLSLLGAACM